MKKLGFAFIPSSIEDFYLLSEKMATELNLSFFLERGATIPHVSLFQGIFPDEREVIQAFSELSLNKNLANQIISGSSVWAEKIIFLDIENNPGLQSVHEAIFNRMFPLSTGKSADPQIFVGISEGQRESFSQTGYPFSLKEYHPHMTLGHLSHKKDIDQYLTSHISRASITFEKCIIFVVGDKGICTEILYEYMI